MGGAPPRIDASGESRIELPGGVTKDLHEHLNIKAGGVPTELTEKIANVSGVISNWSHFSSKVTVTAGGGPRTLGNMLDTMGHTYMDGSRTAADAGKISVLDDGIEYFQGLLD